MGVPREDLLLLMRALKRGDADVRSVRKALDRLSARPVSLLEALHLPAAQAEALKGDSSQPDPVADRLHLEVLRQALVDADQATAGEWEKFVASLARGPVRHAWPPLSVPQEFDGYALQWELVRRERGVVYRAKDRDGRDVAIKVFRPDVSVPPDLPRVNGMAYAAAGFVDGETLEAKRPSPKRAAEAIARAADQLRGRTHGALSPARIAVRKDDSVAVLGWPFDPPVAGSDVRALGAILQEAVAGSEPSPRLEAIISCALAEGYGSTGELADDLARYLKGEPVTGRKAVAAPPRRREKPWLWITAAAAAAILAGYLLYPKPPEAKPAPPPVAQKAPAAPAPAPAPAPASDLPLTAEEEQKLYDRCIAAQARGDGDAVAAASHEALSRGARRDWPCYHLATHYLGRDDLDKALEYASRGLETTPGSRDFLELRAQAHVFRGEARKALSDLDGLYGKKSGDLNKQILKLSREDADPRTKLLRGVFYYLKRHYETAGEDFTAAIQGGCPRGLVWRALAFQGARNRARAEQDARAYLGKFPNDFASDEVRSFLKELEQ